MRSFFVWVTSRPKLVLAIAACVAAIGAVFIFRLTRDTSPDAFIPRGHPALRIKREVDDRFDLREPIAVGVIRDAPSGVFYPDTLRLIRGVTLAIQGMDGIDPEGVLSIATESGVFFEDGEPGFEPFLESIPEDLTELQKLRDEFLGYELYRGTLVAEDGSAACILIRPRDVRRADDLYRQLTRLLESSAIADQVKGGEKLVVAGEAAVRAHMGVAVSDDALRMNFVCPVVMAVLIVLAYRTVRGTVLPLCVIGGASSLALGSMAACGVPIYIVTNGIFVIIMALGVADSLHLLGQYYEEQLDLRGRDARTLVVDACMALWFPLLITTLTDLAGFFALYVAGVMPPIRYFGLFTCVGVAGALIYSYTVVPAGLALLPLRASTAIRPEGRLDLIGVSLRRLGVMMYRRRGPVLAVGALLIAAAGWASTNVVVNDARILAFKNDHPIVRANNALNEHFDGTSHLNIAVTAKEQGAMLQADVLRRIEELERFTESLPYVGGTHSLAGWVKRAHQKMNKEDPAFYAIPDDPFDTQFYLNVLSDKKTSPMARLLGEVIDDTYTQANLIVRMRSSQFIHQRAVIEPLERYLAESFNDDVLHAELAGRVHLDYQWLKLIQRTHVSSVALSVAGVLLFTGLLFRSPVAGLLCTLTVGVAVLVNYAIMGWFDIPLGVGTSMFAAIAIGAGVNFPIHILDRLRVSLGTSKGEPVEVFADTLAFTGRAVFFTAWVVAVGFLLLCVSQFRTLVHFGLLIGVGMMVSFVASVTLLPALVAACQPRFLWPGRAKGPRPVRGCPKAGSGAMS